MPNPKAIQMRDYKPYLPEGVRLPVVGDKVTIRVSSECEFRCPNGCNQHWCNAKEGTVDYICNGIGDIQCGNTERWDNCPDDHANDLSCDVICSMEVLSELKHPYQVFYPCGHHLGWYAATELTVVKGHSDHDG